MSVGPVVSTMSGFPSGRIVDRWDASSMRVVGLVEMAAGAFALAMLPALLGVAGYIAAIVILTPGYQLFQAANNTAVMMDVSADQRGLISGILSLSRNLGLISGASVMGAVFAFASGTSDIANATPDAVTTGMRATFAVAGVLIIAATAVSIGSRARASRPSVSEGA